MKKYPYILLILVSPIFAFSQNVGIGTTTPDFKLDVESLIDARARIYSPSSGFAGFLLDNNLQQYFIGVEADFVNSRFAIYDNTAGALRFQISTTGNVGIGNITTPSAKLEVEGGIKADSLDVQSGLIKNVADPVSVQDAATKAYVDASTSSPTYTIGLSAEQGGYIFWVSTDGKHGLVTETIDQSSSSDWYEAQDIISNPSNHSANGDDFRDWRMPTKYELNEMYLQKDSIGGFSDAIYWSSTEFKAGGAWTQFFLIGSQNLDPQDITYAVRAVRAF